MNSVQLSYHYFCLFLEPSLNVTLRVTGSDSMEISWQSSNKTGSEAANITAFMVLCESDFATKSSIVSKHNHTMEMQFLTPYMNYTCCVSVNTTHGPSGLACDTQTTLESGII